MKTDDETLQKIQVLKKWSKEHDLKLFRKVIGDDVVEMKDDSEVLDETWLSYCNHSYGSYHIESIPEEVEVLQKIERFEFNDVHLKILPDSLCKLQNMRDLYLQRNDIEELPTYIGELKNLAYLDVSNNTISKLPQSIGDLEA